jgi:hypothetical protein
VISRASARFWKAFGDLPSDVKDRVREAYKLFATDPHHPSLRLKKVHQQRPIYSARIDRAYRALGVRKGDAMIWFWVGDHDAYERLLKAL